MSGDFQMGCARDRGPFVVSSHRAAPGKDGWEMKDLGVGGTSGLSLAELHTLDPSGKAVLV